MWIKAPHPRALPFPAHRVCPSLPIAPVTQLGGNFFFNPGKVGLSLSSLPHLCRAPPLSGESPRGWTLCRLAKLRAWSPMTVPQKPENLIAFATVFLSVDFSPTALPLLGGFRKAISPRPREAPPGRTRRPGVGPGRVGGSLREPGIGGAAPKTSLGPFLNPPLGNAPKA